MGPITRVSKIWETFLVVRGNVTTEEGPRDTALLALKTEERDRQSKNGDVLQELKEAKKHILS